MNKEQLSAYSLFFEDVTAHLKMGFTSDSQAIDSLQAIAFNALMTIEKIKRHEETNKTQGVCIGQSY